MTKQQQLQLAHQTSRKCRLCLYASIGLVLTMVFIKMILANRLATWGKTLENIERETQAVKQENLLLKTQLAQKTGGLIELEQAALAKGFIINPAVKYYPGGVSVAQKLP